VRIFETAVMDPPKGNVVMETHNPPAEADLIGRLRSGDQGAYEQLVRDNIGRMLAVARRFLKNDEDAQDAVQEAFVNAFRSIDRFEGGARLSTWLHRIVVNAALMKLRSKRRRPESSIDELLPTFREDGHLDSPNSQWRSLPDTMVVRDEDRRYVREAIDKLPDTYRNVLLLRDIEGLDTAESAKVLGISENATKVRLHRARQALQSLLEPRFREETAS
jgi:RNA polymerase sigma-70 factor (ECF subfamily)